MALAIKVIPHLLSWCAIFLVLVRGAAGVRKAAAAAGCAGFALGAVAAPFLLRALPGDLGFGIVRDVVGASFLLLLAVSVAALYRSTGEDAPAASTSAAAVPRTVAVALAAGLVAGGICGCRLSGGEGNLLAVLLLVLAGCALAFAVSAAEKLLPRSLTVTPSGMAVAIGALLLFSSSSIIRLDLFAPLTMKVMKFTHDFVHQFFESMLIPDHLFIKSYLWGYIGLLFGKEVGFWGALLIWFTPVVLLVLAVSLERLPKVSHIRQGAQRRKLLAEAIRNRRLKFILPALSALVLAFAVYRSLYPSVEYWDPKPILVAASPAGEIFIPRKGESDLDDGKLHKYLFKRGGKEARFFVLMTPAGKLTVDLDACAICKPDGYGQAEGSMVCYYCKTLIPLETIGQAGGCNPVPVPFTEKEDGVRIDGLTLINTWSETVQSTTKGKGGGK